MSDLKKTVDIVFSGKDNMSQSLSKMRAGFNNFKSSVVAIAAPLAKVAAGLTAAGAAGVYFVKEGLESADAIAKTADAIGITTAKLQEYQFIAGRSGVATSAMNQGFKTFAKRLGELKHDKGALLTFLKEYDAELVNTLKGTKDTGEALDIFMDAMAGVGDQSIKTALAAAGFSKSVGVSMTVMTKGGKKALDGLRKAFHDLGGGIEEAFLRNAEGAVDAMGDLAHVIGTELGRTAARLAPEMEALAKFFTENRDDVAAMADAFIKFIKVDVAGWVESVDWAGIGSAIATVGDGIATVFTEISKISGKSVKVIGFLSNMFGGDFGSDLYDALHGIPPEVDKINTTLTDTATVMHKIPWDKASDGAKELKDDIEEIPTEKQIEIKMQGDIDKAISRIKAQADIVQAAFEWKAKVDIAEAEADAKRVAAAFEATAESVTSITSAIASMTNALGSQAQFIDRNKARQALEQQLEMQERAMVMQEKLTEAELAYMDMKMQAMEAGEGLIKIDSSGLEPALEMVMWQIIEKVQIRASENMDEFLLGIPS